MLLQQVNRAIRYFKLDVSRGLRENTSFNFLIVMSMHSQLDARLLSAGGSCVEQYYKMK